MIHIRLLDAKLEKIHPPIYWKALDYKNIDSKTRIKVKGLKENCLEESHCVNGCNYTTLVYKHTSNKELNNKGFFVFVDFQHNGLEHGSWKESIKESRLSKDKLNIKSDKRPSIEISLSNLNHKQQFFNNQYLKQQEIVRYFKTHLKKDHLFRLDKNSYPNRPMPMSRRPRDALHIDFYPAVDFEGSKTEATFKTFYHRKYLVKKGVVFLKFTFLLIVASPFK